MLFRRLPEVTHPNFSPLLPFDLPSDGVVGRVEAALLLPTVALAVWILFTYLAKVKTGRPPLPEWLINENTGAKSINRFEPTYETIIFGVTGLLLLMHAGFLAATLSLPAWSFQVLTACIGLGLIAIGNVMPRLRQNWIAGVRTKRTLTDSAAWAKTHRLAGIFLMIAGAIVILASVIAPRYAIAAALVLPLISLPLATYRTAQMETN